MIVLDLSQLYVTTAKIDALSDYQSRARELTGEGNDIILTGAAPVWLYLAIAHTLHGKARKLYYRAPALEEDLLIFDHDPY